MATKTASGRSASSKGTARRTSQRTSVASPPVASVAAAQKVLRTIERRETSLDTKLKRHKKTVKALNKSAANHRDTVKSLKADLKKVRKMRKTVSSTV